MNKSIRFYLGFFLFFCLISVPIILPYFHPGYFPTHDGEWAVVRLADMFRTLRDFQIPARYSGNLNFGYGYPLFNFVYPFPYYLGVVIHFLGIGFVDTIKILFAGSVFLSAFFMFLASKILWKSTWAGIVSAILYVYFPYRMVDLYVRGSMGESLSFVLFPLLFYLAIKLVNKFSVFLVGGIAVFVAILVMTHNIMTVLFLPVYIAFIAFWVIIKNKKAIKPFIISIFFGLGLSAFFWIPAIFEKSNILLSQIPIADRNLYFVTFNQLLFPKWGYGVPTDPNGFSYQLGLAHLVVLIVAFFIFLFTIRHSGKSRSAGRIQNLSSQEVAAASDSGQARMTGFLLIATLIYIFLLFKQSGFLWENLPLLSEINYPWISLGILGFLISLLAGFLCKQIVGKYVMVVLGIAAMLMVLPYAKPEFYIDKGDDYYLTNQATTTSSNELMPLWVKKLPFQRVTEKVEIIGGVGEIKNVFVNSKQIKFFANMSSKSVVRVNTIYYPGWKIDIDGANVPIFYSNEKGVMDIIIPPGSNIVSAVFSETPIRIISDIISLSSLFALFLIVIGARSKLLFR